MSDYSYFGGIDLAKNHFSIHVVDSQDKVVLHKSVTRSKLLATIANMPPMRIGLEACGGAHYWARTLSKLGHDARIMAVKYVASHRTPVFKTTCQRLLKSGKPKKVALIACVRKRWL